MSPQDMAAQLDTLGALIDELTTDPREWTDRADLAAAVEVWDRLDRLIAALNVLRRDHGVVLAHRIPDQITVQTLNGPIELHRHTEKSEKWDGHGVLGAVAQPVIDAHGERIDAVPVDIARAIIPACGQGATSSKWKMTELRKLLDDDELADLRDVTWGDTVVARGPKWNRPSKPVHLVDTDDASSSQSSTG